jgi:hypothetical protein
MLNSIVTALSIGGAVMKCKPCLAVLAAIALLFGGGIYGVTVEKARSEARIEKMKRDAAAAAEQRDAGIKADLEGRYGPKLAQLEAQKKLLESEVAKHAKTKPAKTSGAPAGKCTIGPDALRLRKLSGR